MRFALRAFKGLLATCLTVAFLVYGFWHFHSADRPERPNRAESGERVFKVRAGVLRPSDVTPQIASFGRIKSWRRAPLTSPVVGEVIWISDRLRDGAAVSAGELLLRIDPLRAELALAQAKTAVREAEARQLEAIEALALAGTELEAAQTMLDLRERQLGRQRELAGRGSTSKAALDNANMDRVVADQSLAAKRLGLVRAENAVIYGELALETSRIALDRAERDLADTSIEAPFDGVLSDVDAALGRAASANTTLAEIVDLTALEVEIDLSAADLTRLLDEEGQLLPQPILVHQRSGVVELSAEGTLLRAAAGGDTGGSGRVVFASLRDAGAFRPGDFVRVTIDAPAMSDVALVPPTAIDADGNILIIEDDNRLAELAVQTVGYAQDRAILAGVPFGARYVINRLTQLGPGTKVELVDEFPIEGAGDGVASQDRDRRAKGG